MSSRAHNDISATFLGKTLLLITLIGVGLVASMQHSFAQDSLRYAEDRSPGIINPLFSTTMSEARICELVFEGLFVDDENLRSVPALAESFLLSEDQSSMTIQLQKNVRWHDAMPFSAEDVVFTIRAMKHPKTASTEAGRVGWIAEAKAIDTHTLHLSFRTPQSNPQDRLHFKILPAHKFDSDAVPRSHTFRNRPIGTGQYFVVGFNNDNSVTLQRYDNHRNPGKIGEVITREVADKNYQSKLLTYESLEALVRVLPRDLAALQSNRNVDLYPYQTNSWWYLGFNHKRPLFKDGNVRKAISFLVDKQSLLSPIGTGQLLSGPYVMSSPYYNHDVPSITPSNAVATALLNEAGYSFNGRHWTKNGERLIVRIATRKNIEIAQDVVINLQSQLQSQGIGVEISFFTLAEWKTHVWNERDFDIILSAWSFDRNEDIREQFHSEGTRNFVGYASPTVDDLLDQAKDAMTPYEKKTLLREAHATIAGDTPVVFLWTLDSYAAFSTRAKNVVVHPFYFFTWIHHWEMN